MPKIIFTSRYIKGGKQARNLIDYMATRDGVEMAYGINSERPSTQNQRQLIDEVLRAIPDAAELFEYEDFQQSPTVRNASAFITAAFEQNPSLWNSVRNYVDYVARRPGAQRSALSGHGLWNDSEQPIVLSKVKDEVATYRGNIWTHVVSLRREDAERTGYTSMDDWRSLVLKQLPAIAEAMKIPPENLRWYAAYHDKDSNPHIHMIVYSQNPTQGYLTETGIEKLRSAFARDIYADEFMHIYERKDMARRQVKQYADKRLQELAASLGDGDPALAQLLFALGEQLRQSKGKKQYGYLKPALKAQVDEIVRRLAADPSIHEMYRHWCELNADVKRIYTSKIDAPPPLEHEKAFKTIQNMVVRQALEMAKQGHDFVSSDDMIPKLTAHDLPEPEFALPQRNYPGLAAGNLLRHLANMIRQDYEQQRQRYEQAVDHKLMAKIRRKKQEQGQKFE